MSNAFDETVENLRKQGLNSDEILEELSRLFADKEMEKKIRNLLNKICMPVNITGYDCWVDAIKIYKKARGKKLRMMTDIYSPVAKKRGTTTSWAERAMRFAVERVFDRCPVDIIDSVFGNNRDIKRGKLKNSEFLVIMAEQI